MIIVTEEQVEALKPYIENLFELIDRGNVQDFLDAIDDVIVDNIIDNNDESDAEGIRLQRIWDQIFNQN